MNDMERRKFEDEFQDAFKEAQINPSEQVWTNIELDLEKAEGGEMKRRLRFYKLLAAASVVFAMSVAGVGYFTWSKIQDQMVQNNSGQELNDTYRKEKESATIRKEQNDSVGMNGSSNPLLKQEAIAEINQEGAAENIKNEESKTNLTSDTFNKEVLPRTNTSIAVHEPVQLDAVSTSNHTDVKNNSSKKGNDSFDEKSTSSSYAVNKTSVKDANYSNTNDKNVKVDKSNDESGQLYSSLLMKENNTEKAVANSIGAVNKLPSKVKRPTSLDAKDSSAMPNPFTIMLAQLNDQEKEMQTKGSKENASNSEKLWTSVGFAAGAFNTVNSSVASSSSSRAFNNVADQQATSSGVSYSVGVSVGGKLSNRWVLQGGVNYQTQTSDYTASAVGTSDFKNFISVSLNDIQSVENLVPVAPHSVNSSLQFVTLPVQAGYLLVNKKFGVQLNGGVATDFFLQNTITPESKNLQKTTQTSGDESPYRSVNFSGLVGTEFSYRIGDHYRLALNPGLRYPLNSIYKSDQPVAAMPLTFDVGLRFRYIFK